MVEDAGATKKSDGATPTVLSRNAVQLVLKVLAWVWAILMLLAAVTSLVQGNALQFILMLLISLLALPPLWVKVRESGLSVPIYVRVILSVILIWVTGAVAPPSPEQSDMPKTGNTAEAEMTDPVAARLAELQDTIAPDAVAEMERTDYSKTYSKLGQSQFDKANALARWAAVAAAESEQCPSVDLVGISERATREKLQWYVDCGNKERFFIEQAQAEAMLAKYDPSSTPEARERVQQVAVAEPASARWKDFNEGAAVTSCKALVRSTMIDQGSFDAAWTWDSEKDADTGLVTIQQDFEADNGFGGTISSRYHCVIDTNLANRITELSIREPDGWRELM